MSLPATTELIHYKPVYDRKTNTWFRIDPKLEWVDKQREMMEPRLSVPRATPPQSKKLVWPPPMPSYSNALYGDQNAMVDGEQLDLSNISKYISKVESKKRLQELLDDAPSIPQTADEDEYINYGNEYGESTGSSDIVSDYKTYDTCSDLCRPLIGQMEPHKQCLSECGKVYAGNPAAARGGTKRRKHKRSKKTKTRQKITTKRNKKKQKKTKKNKKKQKEIKRRNTAIKIYIPVK